MTEQPLFPTRQEFERARGIPPDRFCGLTAAEMSRAIVAHGCGPREPGAAVGYWPAGSAETRRAWLREAFGSEADIEAIAVRLQCFLARVAEALEVDWMLDNEPFDRAVSEGLAALYPDLSADARSVITGSYSYSHMK